MPWQTTALRLVQTAAGKPWKPSWLGRPPRRRVSSRTQASMSPVEMPGAMRAAIAASVAAAARPARRIASTSRGPEDVDCHHSTVRRRPDGRSNTFSIWLRC